MAPMWFSFGLMAYFIILRIVDRVQQKVAKECNFDCAKCTCHCAGYHCYCERKRKEEKAASDGSSSSPDIE